MLPPCGIPLPLEVMESVPYCSTNLLKPFIMLWVCSAVNSQPSLEAPVAGSSRQECWYDRSQRPAPAYRPGWFPDRLNAHRRHRLVPRCHKYGRRSHHDRRRLQNRRTQKNGSLPERVYQSPDRCFQYRHQTRDIPVVEVDHVYVMTLIEAFTGPDGRAWQPFNQVLPCTLASRKAGLVDSQSFC